MDEVDLTIFLGLIEDDQRINFLRIQHSGDYFANVYQGRNGNAVLIDTSESSLPVDLAHGYLRDLGIEDLIPFV